MTGISEIDTTIRIVAGFVSAVASGLNISEWMKRRFKTDFAAQMVRDLEAIRAVEFNGWIDFGTFPEEFGSGYFIYIYHEELDELDRIELREPGQWRADGADRLRKILGIIVD